MYRFIIAISIGIIALSCFKRLPAISWMVYSWLVISIISYCLPKNLRNITGFISISLLGLLWALIHAHALLNQNLPENLINKPVVITGKIAGLPQEQSHLSHFLFTTTDINGKSKRTLPILIRLSWLQPHPVLIVGDEWRLQVRLKPPHGLYNPGGFDYEKWLFANGIRATGYVVNSPTNQLINSSHYQHVVDHFRQAILAKINQVLLGESTTGFIAALTVGVQSGITPGQWQILQATGTNHLMAIAGVHIGFVTGFIYVLIKFIWRRCPRFMLVLPTPLAAAAGALAAALTYSALAGFALPTQRALIMVFAVMITILMRKLTSPWYSFLVALTIILILEPLVSLTVSFWLSFAAVFFIIYGTHSRLVPTNRWQRLWEHWGRIQWIIAITLIPLTIWLFNQASLIALIANLIAVPWVGFFVLAFCLVGALLLFIWQPFGSYLLLLAAKSMAVIWWVLAWLAGLHDAVWYQSIPNVWILIAALMGALILISPPGFPVRWLSIIFFMPLILFKPQTPPAHAVWITLLDVGQGLSAVIQTQHHVLIYDTGPKLGEFDAGNEIVLPFLRYQHINTIDTLLISHGDNDHSGGAQSIISHVTVSRLLTSVPDLPDVAMAAQPCQAGTHWNWDGVEFTLLYPPPAQAYVDNNSSCVLKISNGQHAILFTGDIEKNAESYLIKTNATALAADILVAPHHGSSTSSSMSFIHAVNPQYVLFATGYLNRFHFPAASVVERYQQMSAHIFNTAYNGAILIKFGAAGNISVVPTRQATGHFWNRR